MPSMQLPGLAYQDLAGRTTDSNGIQTPCRSMSLGQLCLVLAFAAFAGLSGCQTAIPTASQRTELADLNATIDSLGEDLASQLAIASKTVFASSRSVIVDRFVDSQTGQVNAAYRRIADRIPESMAKRLPNFSFRPMQGKEISGADFVLTGSVTLDAHTDKGKHYRVFTSVTDLKTGMIVANASAWLRATRELDVAPEPAYGDSPMYLSDRSVGALVSTTKTLPGAAADPLYLSQLSTSALLNEAEASYNRAELTLARQYYQEAAARTDGQLMRTYSGLYLVHQKTGNTEGAEKAFAELVALGLAAQQLSVKFLFKVATTTFIDDLRQSGQYAMWLRQIARQASARQSCLEVSGHTSRSGSESFNEKLSMQRADSIVRALVQFEPSLLGKLRGLGRGFRDNIIGTGSDDARDAIDRRVEFKVIACP